MSMSVAGLIVVLRHVSTRVSVVSNEVDFWVESKSTSVAVKITLYTPASAALTVSIVKSLSELGSNLIKLGFIVGVRSFLY